MVDFNEEINNKYLEYLKELALRKIDFVLNDDSQVTHGDLYNLKERIDVYVEEEKHYFLPVPYLFYVFGCNEFEKHCIIMLMCFELFEEVRNAINQELALSLPVLTKSFLILSYEYQLKPYEEVIAFDKTNQLMRFFFDVSERDMALDMTFKMQARIKLFIVGSVDKYVAYKPLYDAIDPEEYQDHYDLHSNELKCLSAYLGSHADERRIINLFGAKGSGRRWLIYHCIQDKHQEMFCINLELLKRIFDTNEKQFFELIREMMIYNSVPVLVMNTYDKDKVDYSEYTQVIKSLQIYFQSIFILSERKIWFEMVDFESLFYLSVQKPTLFESQGIWQRESRKYSLSKDVNPLMMANRFSLSIGQIKNALKLAEIYSRTSAAKRINAMHLKRSCYNVVDRLKNEHLNKIDAYYNWDDLVVSHQIKEKLNRVCNQVKYKEKVYETWDLQSKITYGKGVSLILSGPPGTGKTMAAQVLANDVGLDLYRVELASIVSKYVGETEKNLNDIFEQGQKSNIILLFDEADVLFSKRTEVKNATDKYSNMEAAYMLQKIEDYEGIVILSTNYLVSFDEAFKRRIKFVIDFTLPTFEERRQLWSNAIPSTLPCSEIDLDYLSHFELSGSNIKNIVIFGAFEAAADKEVLRMKHLVKGIQNEFSKNGKVMTENDIGEYYMFLS